MTARLTLLCSMWSSPGALARSAKIFLRASQYASATDRSPPLPPPKSRAWRFKRDGMPLWPTDFGGTAVCWRSDRGDGDTNSFREMPFAQKND